MDWPHPFDDFADRVVLVTGGGTGIGAAVAQAFAACGAQVAIHCNASTAEAEAVREAILSTGGRADVFRADLRDPAACGQLVDTVAATFGSVDVLINNAGNTFERQPTPALDDAAFRQLVDLNFGAVFATSRAVVAHFRAQGRGTIINTGSISARIGGTDGTVVYAAAKAAVATFTRGLARELAPEGFRVNAVAPGVIDTRVHHRYTDPGVMAKFTAAIPMGRVASPHECAGAYLFLASELLASFVTGQVIEVNGGQLMV
ncbi:MAG TPA: SDR family NAD(P)-dependent oxidoreductase [Devosia sp.]|nr:SDR family NAD(P)-dependent oxidoreductase [Devosia sp.]